MVTTWPKNFPGLGTGAQRIADNITSMSDGRLTVNFCCWRISTSF